MAGGRLHNNRAYHQEMMHVERMVARLMQDVCRPAGTMPPFTAKVISDAALADISAFLQTVPASPPVASIPLLNR